MVSDDSDYSEEESGDVLKSTEDVAFLAAPVVESSLIRGTSRADVTGDTEPIVHQIYAADDETIEQVKWKNIKLFSKSSHVRF